MKKTIIKSIEIDIKKFIHRSEGIVQKSK